MLSTTEKTLIFELIQNVIYCEQLLENSRIKINQHLKFSLMPVFQRLDQSKKGQIGIHDIMQFFQENQIDIETNEAYYMLRRLDYNKDGQVTFKDFMKAMLPSIDSNQRFKTALKDPYTIQKQIKLSQAVEEDLILFFSTLLTFIREQQKIKKKLISQPNFNVFRLYYSIDTSNQGYIEIQSFHEFLQELHLSDQQYYYFFQAVDIDQDGKITCNELIDILMNFPQDKITQNDNEIYSSINGKEKKLNDSENSQLRIKTDESILPSKRTLKVYNSFQSIKTINPVLNDDETILKQNGLIYKNNEMTAQKQQNFASTDLLLTATPDRESRKSLEKRKAQNFQSEWIPNSSENEQEYKQYCSSIKKSHTMRDLLDQGKKQDRSFLMKNFLVKCITTLKKIEKIKRQLSIKEEFNLLDAFRLFDTSGKGYAECLDIKQAFIGVGIETSDEDIELILNQYSKRKESLLRYSDFCRMITPFHYDFSQILKQKKASYKQIVSIDELFHSLTMQYYQDLLFLILNFEIDLNQFKQKMKFKLDDLIRMFNLQDQSFLDEEALRQFLKEQHIYPTSSDLKRIIAHFNFNELGEGLIQLSVLCL